MAHTGRSTVIDMTYERHEGQGTWEGGAVYVIAHDYDSASVYTTHNLNLPVINRTPVGFRILVRRRGDGSWFVSQWHTWDGRGPLLTEATVSQGNKIRRFALDLVISIPDSVLQAGAIRQIEGAIESEQNQIDRLKLEIAEAEERKRAFEISLDQMLRKPV